LYFVYILDIYSQPEHSILKFIMYLVMCVLGAVLGTKFCAA